MSDTIDEQIKYLTEALFQSIISKHLIRQPFKIVSLKHQSAVGAGENFLSTIIRNNVVIELNDGSTREFSFISKIAGSAIVDVSIVDDMKVFPKEVKSYVNILPELEQIWKDRANIDISFGPKLYYHELEPNKILIFEDLYRSGFKMGNRMNGLTEQQVWLILEKMSKWHAASRIYYDKHGPNDPMFQKGFFNSGMTDYVETYYPLLYTNFIDILTQTDAGIDDYHIEVLKNWDGQIVKSISNSLTLDPNEFNLVAHGDLWINNLMLEYENDSEILTNVKFIDYQLGYYGTPIVEVIYFLLMSVHYEIVISKFDDFIAFYHRKLVESLKLLNYQTIPTLKELWISILKRSAYITCLFLSGLPTILSDHKRYGIDMKQANQDSDIGYETRKKMMSDPKVFTALVNFVKFFGNRGLLDL